MSAKKPQFKYMLIDGNALIHRGYHAIPSLSTKSGEPTNAVYGFVSILLRAIKDLRPTHIACSFDLAGPTFRHEEYAEYKGTRVKAADDLYEQIPRVKEVVAALNIPIYEMEGYEADDVLGTLASHICKEEKGAAEVMIVTGDLDTLQLVNECVKIYTLRKGITDTAVYDEAAIKERYGLAPAQMLDYKALRGDPSDNIKGVKGIGDKGAMDLIKEFGGIENLYKEIHAGGKKVTEKIKPRTLQLLTDGEKDARQALYLSKIVCDLPLDIKLPPYEFTRVNLSGIIALFQELEFKSLVDKLPKNYLPGGPRDAAKSAAKADKAGANEALGEKNPQDRPANTVGEGCDYVLVDTAAKLEALTKKLKTQKEIAIDTETTSINAIVARLVGVSLSFAAKEAYYIPAEIVLSSKEFRDLIMDPKLRKIGQNIKYDLLSLQNEEIAMEGIYFDTMISSYLLNAGTRQYSLDTLAFNELGYQMQPISELIGTGKNAITMDQVPMEKVSLYACEDADITFRLAKIYEPLLKQEKLLKIFDEIEMPLIEVLANMERNGIRLDVGLLEKLSLGAQKLIRGLEKEIYRLTGEEFNIKSPKQLKEVLFDKLGLEAVGNKKTKTGISTAAGELEKMLGQHPVIEKIMQYREVTKLESTYLSALPQLVNPQTGRLHTSYNQTIAATGRLSSTDPNLQNIPVRGEGLGAEIRKAFVADKGYKLVSLDYSQIELRIVAHIAKDKAMLETFQRDEDIHLATAMAVFGLPAEKITADMRRDAKTINFGILYGLSSFGLSSRIGEVSHGDAKEFIEKYFAAYPQVRNYMDRTKDEVNQLGLVKNELGRIRKFPEIRSSQYFIRAAAERAAINFPIQSLQADIIKMAMINIYQKIHAHPEEIKMLLQVHDELVFEIREDKVEDWVAKLRPLMENSYKLSLPIKVDAKVGDNWGEMKKV
jgi:DNA polymerase-1